MQTAVAECAIPTMGVRTGGREGPWSPVFLNLQRKKVCFLSFEGKKNQISPLLAPTRKIFGKIHSCPP